MCEDLKVPFLGSLPLDPKIARCCDEGKDFITELPDSPAVIALYNIVESKFGWCIYELNFKFLFFSDLVQKC